jgi:hypothetical protein
MPKEQFKREVEKELTGRGTEPHEIIYFKIYKSQIPVVEQALETAALMLGTDKSLGYCLEMICADFLAGAVTPISPWWGLWASVTRREIKSGDILAPEERVSAQQALEMYTSHGAYLGFEEHDKGSLEASKLADFILLDRNPLTVPVSEIKGTQVLATYVGGQVVYQKPNPESSQAAARNPAISPLPTQDRSRCPVLPTRQFP